jgi:hypothetical protein
MRFARLQKSIQTLFRSPAGALVARILIVAPFAAAHIAGVVRHRNCSPACAVDGFGTRSSEAGMTCLATLCGNDRCAWHAYAHGGLPLLSGHHNMKTAVSSERNDRAAITERRVACREPQCAPLRRKEIPMQAALQADLSAAAKSY